MVVADVVVVDVVGVVGVVVKVTSTCAPGWALRCCRACSCSGTYQQMTLIKVRTD